MPLSLRHELLTQRRFVRSERTPADDGAIWMRSDRLVRCACYGACWCGAGRVVDLVDDPTSHHADGSRLGRSSFEGSRRTSLSPPLELVEVKTKYRADQNSPMNHEHQAGRSRSGSAIWPMLCPPGLVQAGRREQHRDISPTCDGVGRRAAADDADPADDGSLGRPGDLRCRGARRGRRDRRRGAHVRRARVALRGERVGAASGDARPRWRRRVRASAARQLAPRAAR